MDYVDTYLQETIDIIQQLDKTSIRKMIDLITDVKQKEGRIFIIGCGGGAGNATHAVNDFRKICGIETYTPTDNVSELTARTNDDGWDSVFIEYLKTSRLSNKDMVFVFSVGGGNKEKKISENIVKALQYAQQKNAMICGIVGRDGGYTAKVADACVIVPTVNPASITPHTEAFQALIWHLLVSHPDLLTYDMKWESTK